MDAAQKQILIGLACMSVGMVLIPAGDSIAKYISSIAPIDYLQLVAASLIGLFYFKDSINPIAACGLALIVLTGLLKIPRGNAGTSEKPTPSV